MDNTKKHIKIASTTPSGLKIGLRRQANLSSMTKVIKDSGKEEKSDTVRLAAMHDTVRLSWKPGEARPSRSESSKVSDLNPGVTSIQAESEARRQERQVRLQERLSNAPLKNFFSGKAKNVEEEENEALLSSGENTRGEEVVEPDSGREQSVVVHSAANIESVAFGTPITQDILKDLEDDVSVFKNYELLEMHAQGAESVLYRARSGKYEFCVKSIRRNWLNNLIGHPLTKKYREKLPDTSYKTKCRHLQNEFMISQMLRHWDENFPIVKIFGLRKITNLGLEIGYDLLMEFIPGHDLGEKLICRILPLEDKVRVAYLAAKALSYLHKRQIVHLDIKPSNFMLTSTGQVKLMDFGVSILAGRKPRGISGTMGYLSPEQICRSYVDEGTDMFAFGVAMGTLFGGRQLPQTQDDINRPDFRDEASNNLENTELPAISDLPELKEMPEISSAITDCTIFKRESRIRSCATFLAQMKRAAKKYNIEINE